MKVLLLVLFVAAVTAAPLPEENVGEAVQMIVNGVPEGQALDISDIVDIKLNEHVAGEVVAATDLLHPYTAVGIAEAAAAAATPSNSHETSVINPEPVVLPQAVLPEVAAPDVIVPEPVVLPSPALPEVVAPTPVVLPSPAVSEVIAPQPVVLPSPAVPVVVIPEPVVLPSPAIPEVVPAPVVTVPEVEFPDVAEELPIPAPQFSGGELYNDGMVQVNYNGSQESGAIATLKSWFNMFISYFADDVHVNSEQII